jgi:hypothetical protein
VIPVSCPSPTVICCGHIGCQHYQDCVPAQWYTQISPPALHVCGADQSTKMEAGVRSSPAQRTRNGPHRLPGRRDRRSSCGVKAGQNAVQRRRGRCLLSPCAPTERPPVVSTSVYPKACIWLCAAQHRVPALVLALPPPCVVTIIARRSPCSVQLSLTPNHHIESPDADLAGGCA